MLQLSSMSLTHVIYMSIVFILIQTYIYIHWSTIRNKGHNSSYIETTLGSSSLTQMRKLTQ